MRTFFNVVNLLTNEIASTMLDGNGMPLTDEYGISEDENLHCSSENERWSRWRYLSDLIKDHKWELLILWLLSKHYC